MSKLTIACVPGAWHGPEIYASTFQILQQHGYQTVGIPLASVNADPPHRDFDGDVQGVRNVLVDLVEVQGEDVVLVTHSYSGMPGCEAVRGLGKKEREAEGLKGGVVKMVYIMSFALPEGWVAEGEYPDWMKVDTQKGTVTVEPADAKAIFYNSLSDHEADRWIAKLQPQSEGVFHSKTTYAAWKYIPSTFVRALRDNSTFTPEVCDWMIGNARKANPSAFDVVEVCEQGDHCLMIGHPEWLADVLRRSAGETF